MNRHNKNIGSLLTDRQAYWATTFRALGDVAHLVQDLAQPQHTETKPIQIDVAAPGGIA
jgi:hypothetical protein